MRNGYFYVIATEGDLHVDVFGNPQGDPIIFETSMKQSTIEDARRRAASMNGRYGKTVILRCQFEEQYVEFN